MNTPLILIAALLLLPSCGLHVTSDPAKVEHTIRFDFDAALQYCEAVCEGNAVCFQDCARRFLTLLTDPQICVDLNTCSR